MFDLNQFLIPIICGYVYLQIVHLTRYYHHNFFDTKIILHSIIIVFPIYLFSFGLDQVFFEVFNISFLGNLFSFKNDYSYHLFIFSNTIFLSVITNLILNKNRSTKLVLKYFGDNIDKLIDPKISNENHHLKDNLIMITTYSKKVYVGFVESVSDPIGDYTFTIYPLFSGFRDKKQKVKLTENYHKFYLNDLDNSKSNIGVGIVIKKSDVHLITKFDMDFFKKFNSSKKKES